MNHWNSLARALRELHAALLRGARNEYMREHGIAEQIGAGDLLMLATQDEGFAWLRSLSELMTDIDYLRDDPATVDDQAMRGAVRGALEELLRHPDAQTVPSGFAVRYWAHVQADPEVTVAHAAVKQMLASWPQPQGTGHKDLVAEQGRAMSTRRSS